MVQQWSLWFQDILSDGYCDLLVRRYSLDGQLAATVEGLAVEYGTSRKHIKQLLTHALKRLRFRSGTRELESITFEAARQVLQRKR